MCVHKNQSQFTFHSSRSLLAKFNLFKVSFQKILFGQIFVLVTFHKMQILTTIFFRSRRRRFPQVSRFRRNHQHWVSRCIRANVVQAPISRDFLYDWHMPSGLYVSTILFAQYPGCGLQLGRRRFVIAPYWYVHWCLYYWPVHLPCPEFFGTRDKRLKVSQNVEKFW